MRRNIEKSERELKGRMAREIMDYADMAEDLNKNLIGNR